MNENTRVPLPMNIAFEKMNLSTQKTSLENRLASISVTTQLVQDYVPLCDSLEWELSQQYWEDRGLLPFVENDVPFIVNNSGRLSQQCALFLYKHLAQKNSIDEIRILELGAGIGLFARYFLDAFLAICTQENSDLYNKLTYYVTDYSAKTVEQWVQRDIFSNHMSRVIVGICDGMDPLNLTLSNGEHHHLSHIDSIFCNYMLDILPSTVLSKKDDALTELSIQTNIAKDAFHLKDIKDISLEGIRDLVEGEAENKHDKFSPILDSLEFQSKYLPVINRAELYDEILNRMSFDAGKILLNFGAISCIEKCISLLNNDGFILIHDYGPVSQEEMTTFKPAQRFGSSIANGLNFPMLKKYFENKQKTFLSPDGAESASVQCRLVTSNASDGIVENLNDCFGESARLHYEKDIQDAREHLGAGRKNEALDAYHNALLNNQHDWSVTGEIAEFLVLHIQDFNAGVEVATHAVQINPWYSAWLWNILGDALYCLEKFSEAHEAYLQAQRIDENDPRTNLNLAYSYFQSGQFDLAMNSIAVGLTSDQSSTYRARLLEKQQQILAAISGKWLSKQEQMINRNERLG